MGLRPSVFFVDIEAGPTRGGPDKLGAPISIFGKGFGAARGTSRVTIGGVEVAAYMVWGENNAHNRALDMIVVQPGPNVASGPIAVTVNGQPSNTDYTFTGNSGNVYYLAPGGADSAACSASAPCATILHAAADVMRPGDVLLVRGGNYNEGEMWIRSEQGGARGQAKVIKNYPGEEVNLLNPSRDMIVDASYITVSGLNFKNGKSMSAVGWASRNQAGDRFINNTFSGNIAWAAIETMGSDHLLAGNVCEVASSSVGTMGHCYYVSQGSNQKVLYNIASGPPGYGLHLYDEKREATDFQRVIRNVLVEGNVFKNSTQRSGMIVAMNDQGKYGNAIENVTIRNNVFTGNNLGGLVVQGISRDVKIYNNTFYQNGRLALYLESDANLQRVDVRNNLFFQSSNSICKTDCSYLSEAHVQVAGGIPGNVTLTNNSYHPGAPKVLGHTDTNPVTGVVQFFDPSALDFHLQSGSAVIDKGVSIPAVPTDFDGRTRPQGPNFDTGAFEYVGRTPGLASVANGVTMAGGSVAPGGIVTAFGWNLGPAEEVLMEMDGESVSTSLAGTRALLDDMPAPLISVTERRVTALVPYELSNRSEIKMEIEVDGERSNSVTVPVAATSPDIFTMDGSGQGQSLTLNEDGTLNSSWRPAREMSVVRFFAAGLGLTEPAGISGRLATDPLSRPLAPISVWIGGIEAELLYAGMAMGLLQNVFEIVARVPGATEKGPAVPIVLRAGDADSPDNVTVAIR
jgi:uncharacterized protein (TIGR03437 family)